LIDFNLLKELTVRMKWMDRKWIVSAAAAALLLTASPVYAEPAGTSADQTQRQPDSGKDSGHHHNHSHHGNKAHRLERLKEAAEYFGISTEGKTEEQLRHELKEAREKDKAKWERFKAEHKAKRLNRLQEIAAKLGISTEGKSARQLRQEIREACKEKRMQAEGDKAKDKAGGKESKKLERNAKKVNQQPAG
jgi:hypothetical protein